MSSLARIFEKPALRRNATLALAGALGLACADAPSEGAADAGPPPQIESAQAAAPADVAAAPAELTRPEVVYHQLLEEAATRSGADAIALDQRLRAAESEFPLEFRFSYERAKLGVFGRYEHHEAFRRLRRAAEKAIETGRSDAMLEMLRADATPDGPFWKLSRGHSEWREIVAALERGEREALWQPGHEAPARPHAAHARHPEQAPIRAVRETHARAEAPEAAPVADMTHALERLRVVRARFGDAGTAEIPDEASDSAP